MGVADGVAKNNPMLDGGQRKVLARDSVGMGGVEQLVRVSRGHYNAFLLKRSLIKTICMTKH